MSKHFVSHLTERKWLSHDSLAACGAEAYGICYYFVGQVTCSLCKKTDVYRRAMLYWLIDRCSNINFFEKEHLRSIAAVGRDVNVLTLGK